MHHSEQVPAGHWTAKSRPASLLPGPDRSMFLWYRARCPHDPSAWCGTREEDQEEEAGGSVCPAVLGIHFVPRCCMS
eukprot:1348950-Rhodomonas_salina.1